VTAPASLRPPTSPVERAAAVRLLAEAEAADGVRPLSESAELAVRGGDDTGTLLLGPADDRDGNGLLGLVHVQVSGPGEPAVAELVVAPGARRRGHGATLLTAVRRAAAPGPLHVWAHGDLPAARALAARAGARAARLLHQMRRPLTPAPGATGGGTGPAADPLPEPPPPPQGVRLRSFRPGADDDAWVALNARAFASHPEQGRWTVADLRARQAERWFDPDGFLVAERDADGALLGFHWTKVHDAGPDAEGEVYVVGVDPAAQGTGLGRVLVLAGLAHLRERGLPSVMLYVDDDNAAAMRLYTGLGFAPAMTDTLYTLGADAAP
jgi:mycothiol synthase